MELKWNTLTLEIKAITDISVLFEWEPIEQKVTGYDLFICLLMQKFGVCLLLGRDSYLLFFISAMVRYSYISSMCLWVNGSRFDWMIFKVWVLRAHVRRPSHPADFVMEQEWLIRHHIDALLLSKKSQKPKSPLWSIWRTPNAGTKFLLADLLVNLNTIWYRWVCEIFQVDFYSKVDSQLKRIF